jgi:hypothetical protein
MPWLRKKPQARPRRRRRWACRARTGREVARPRHRRRQGPHGVWWLSFPNLRVRSSNLFGRARTPIKNQDNLQGIRFAMQNEIICMATAWPRAHDLLRNRSNAIFRELDLNRYALGVTPGGVIPARRSRSMGNGFRDAVMRQRPLVSPPERPASRLRADRLIS